MKALVKANREDVYNAPIIPWNNGTYTPLANSYIMDLMDTKIHDLGLTVKNENYRVATTQDGLIKGVIGEYNITTDDGEFGQRVMFRNSYDKTMSFAFVCGTVVWICTNGCISGDYQYRRIHKGSFEDGISSTELDVYENIEGGFNMLQKSFEHNVAQLNEMKHIDIGPNTAFELLGELFFIKKVISITQMSIIKKELYESKNFAHLGAVDFKLYDLYNHITEALKTSHPTTYIHNHVTTHTLFEKTFSL